MASYGEPVRTNLDAATAYKVATVLLRAIPKAREFRLLVHLQLMRNYSVYFKGGIYHKFNPARTWAFVGPAPGPSLPRGETALLVLQAFSGRKGVVSRDYFSHLSEFWWLRPQGSRKH